MDFVRPVKYVDQVIAMLNYPPQNVPHSILVPMDSYAKEVDVGLSVLFFTKTDFVRKEKFVMEENVDRSMKMMNVTLKCVEVEEEFVWSTEREMDYNALQCVQEEMSIVQLNKYVLKEDAKEKIAST